MANEYNTNLAYCDNNSFTSAKGASKFFSELIETTERTSGDNACVINGFYVSQATGMKVNILPQAPGETQLDGHCIIKYSDYAYFGWLTDTYELTISASSASGNRYSYVVAYVDLNESFVEEDHEIESPGVLKFVEIAGTTATSPSRPTTNQIQAITGDNPYIVLAEIYIAAGTTGITSSMITDLRVEPMLSRNFALNPNREMYITGFVDAKTGNNLKFTVLNAGDTYPTAQDGEQIICVVLKDAT